MSRALRNVSVEMAPSLSLFSYSEMDSIQATGDGFRDGLLKFLGRHQGGGLLVFFGDYLFFFGER